VNKLNDDGTIMIETSPGSYLKIEKSAISMEWTNQVNKTAVAAK
jgi:preprotein translocase subunit YajC